MEAFLYRRLARLRGDVPLTQSLADLEWGGARGRFRQLYTELGDPGLAERVNGSAAEH